MAKRSEFLSIPLGIFVWAIFRLTSNRNCACNGQSIFFGVVCIIYWIHFYSRMNTIVLAICRAILLVYRNVLYWVCRVHCFIATIVIVIKSVKWHRTNWIDTLMRYHIIIVVSATNAAAVARHHTHIHIKIWKYTILSTFYDSIAIRSNWNDMVNGTVL